MAGSMRSLRSAAQPRERALLVRAREPAVADDVGDQDRRDFPGLAHGAPPASRAHYHRSRLDSAKIR